MSTRASRGVSRERTREKCMEKWYWGVEKGPQKVDKMIERLRGTQDPFYKPYGARARDAQLTTLKNTTRRAHGQKAQRPLAPRPRPSYDHGILHGDFAWLNGSKFSRAGWWVAGAQVRSLRL
eukprot:scaffold2564_cov65-Phaeocystis_antarctica.AAC.8